MTRTIDVLIAAGSPSEVGAAHGAKYADEIHTYMEGRRALSRTGTNLTNKDVEAIAESMVDAHRAYDARLFEEMAAMAEAAGISVAQAIIVGGYTDFIDTVRSAAGGRAFEDTCTTVITPDALSEGAGFLAQTWDMNATATPHVFMLDVAVDGSPRALVFTTHGTLGQIGLNEAGIAVGINNLTMDDGKPGVTWPFAVRKALAATNFASAVRAITDADLAGGHSFLVFDDHGQGAMIEATSTATHVERLNGTPLIHTNHCLVETTQTVEADRPQELDQSSKDRLAHATEWLAEGPHTVDSLKAMLRDDRSICRQPEPPFDYETSGAVIMRPRTRDLWACWGVPSRNEFEHFTVGGS